MHEYGESPSDTNFHLDFFTNMLNRNKIKHKSSVESLDLLGGCGFIPRTIMLKVQGSKKC